MPWEEFRQMLIGISPDTALGRVVAIRAEDRKEVLENFTPEQHRIRNAWQSRHAEFVKAHTSKAQVDAQMQAMKMAFMRMAVLAVPVLLMVACNVLDYATGLMASTYRSQDINSYKSIRGIMKKVCMWLLVVVGAVIDQLLLYASQTAGITLPFTFLVACIVAIWIICNEIISILENIKDMGVAIPAFLLPIVEHVKSQVEEKVNMDNKEDSGDE